MGEFRRHRFILIEADAYTLNYMENKKYPSSDVNSIVDKLKEKFRERNALIRDTFRRYDRDHSGVLNMEEFREALHKFNFDVSDQELITIMRRFDPDGDGGIRYNEFCEVILEDDYKEVENSNSGQIVHGENKFTAFDNQQQAAQAAEQDNIARQERLNEILAAFRERLFPYKDEIQPWFASYDEQNSGHCSQERFAEMLEELLSTSQWDVKDGDRELLMESFFDPDHEDQTRPQSIAVLDEALFG